MAESKLPESSPQEAPPAPAPSAPLVPRAGGRDMALIVGGLGLAALVVVCAAAVLIALLFLRAPHTTPSQIVTINAAAPAGQTAVAAQPAATEAPTPSARRNSANAQDAAVPFQMATPTPAAAPRQKAAARDAATPLPYEARRAVAGTAPRLDGGEVRYANRAPQAVGLAPDAPLPNRLKLVRRLAGKPSPAQPLGAVQENSPEARGVALAEGPDIEYQAAPEAGKKGAAASVALTAARLVKTPRLGGYRALKGFAFLVADLRAANQGGKPLALDPALLEAQDADGLGYPCNPDLVEAGFPAKPLAPGASAPLRAAFLVPDDAPLKALSLEAVAGGDRAVLVLAAQ